MKTLPAAELRKNLFVTLRQVAKRKRPILIERRGRPIAALVPADAAGEAAARGRGLKVDFRKLGAFCERHHVKALYLFGSVLTDAFDAESDIDVMFEPEGSGPGYFEQMKMADELEALWGRPVDLVSRRAVESSTNPIRKQSILDSARVVYGR
ncbi:MAG TPA: type II toxin-antitoxin system prevent-host-death family antitoxin [Polyangiaceae bacterium]|nr:type II toxin-antitoxin system prevent-host-death family antitoxin [Polyangiaceae bacterium]